MDRSETNQFTKIMKNTWIESIREGELIREGEPLNIPTWGLTVPEASLISPKAAKTLTKDTCPTDELWEALIGEFVMPSQEQIDAADGEMWEAWTNLYPRFFFFRTDLRQRLWLNALMRCIPVEPTLVGGKEDLTTFKLSFGVCIRVGYRTPTELVVPRFDNSWASIKRYVTRFGVEPTPEELRFMGHLSPQAAVSKNMTRSVKTMKGASRAQELIDNPDRIRDLFMAKVTKATMKDKDFPGCWIYSCKTRPGTTGTIYEFPFGQGKYMTPVPANNGRRFAYMYMHRDGEMRELEPHARIKNKTTCHPACVNPAHMELW